MNKILESWYATSLYRNFAMRDANERQIILAVVGVVLAALVYLVLWQPVANWSSSAQEAHQREQTLHDWLLANESAARLTASESSGREASSEGLLTIVSRTAEKAQLKLTRFQPESNGVSVVLQKQAFNDVLRWLSMLEKEEQVMVVQASVDADSLSGRVNARFSLRR